MYIRYLSILRDIHSRWDFSVLVTTKGKKITLHRRPAQGKGTTLFKYEAKQMYGI